MSKTTNLLSDFGPVSEPVSSAETKASPILDSQVLPIDRSKKVPNKFPSIHNQPYKIALIGEAPGRDEHYQGIPFVGMSGQLLTKFLSKAHIIRDACFLGNICQYRPHNNIFDTLPNDLIQEGLATLATNLSSFNPNVCLLLGKTALQYALGREDIGNWRGSFFVSTIPGPFYERKCIASYHPAACLRQWEWSPLLMMDIKRAKEEATTNELYLPIRDITNQPSYECLLDLLDTTIRERPNLSVDIEGGVSSLPCCSFSRDGNRSFIVPFSNLDGSSYWVDSEQEYQITTRFVQILADPSIPKVFQNGLYDRFVLQYGYNVFVAGNQHDTMLKFWEHYCELEKSLGFQASILTKEQYYKFERKSSDREAFFRYCCKDSAVTHEISDKLEGILSPEQKRHYRFNMALLNPLLYMELRGIKYNSKLAKERLHEVNHYIYELQYELDTIAGCGFDWDKDRGLSQAKVSNALCYKRNPHQPKAGNDHSYQWCSRVLLGVGKLTNAEMGRLNIETGLSMNIKSKNFKTFIYETLKLPKQYKEDKLTSDYEALLKIQKKSPHKSIELAIDIGILRTRSQMLEIHADSDGRIRCGYNIVGTETGRLSCYTSPTGSGYNLQTIPAENTLRELEHPLRSGMRDLFIADPDHYLFQCDLKGADGWTVGAYMAMLGDPTMLDDLRYGLKPANLVCLLLRHGNRFLDGKSRAEIKELCKEISKDDFDYYLCKQGIWMTCYIGGPRRLANLCLVNSEGKIDMTESEVKDFQAAVHSRYKVRIWHNWMGRHLRENNNTLTAPNGFRRRFFGRDTEILGQALAHLPQVITTWCVNTAMFRLWTDPQNRYENNKLHVEPLHQVHDSINGQWPIPQTEWAKTKVREWFNNEVTVAGVRFVIPFEGLYGTNWSMDSKALVGTI